MTPISSFARGAALLTAFVLTAALWSSTAGAQTQHPLSGNLRYQIGNGLPIPITLQPPPNGPVLAIDGAVITLQAPQGTITIQPSQFTKPSGPNRNQPVNFANPDVFQVNTTIPINFPRVGVPAVFAPSGRTGANTVSYCAGQTVTPAGNPGCAGPSAGTINGIMIYKRTGGELGGPSQAGQNLGSTLLGGADVALRPPGGSVAPCDGIGGGATQCAVLFALATPATPGAQGAPFGFVNGTPGGIPNPGFYGKANIAALGTIVSLASPLGPGVTNPATSYGGPWTAGVLTVSVTQNAGASIEKFVLSGSDNRNNATGQGSVSLVTGSISDRTLSAPNANRGWLNLQIKPPFGVVPAMTTPGLAAAIGLIALVGAYFVRKRLS